VQRELLGDIRRALALIGLEQETYAALAGELETLAPVEDGDASPRVQSFTVRGVVRAISAALGTLADARQGKPVSPLDVQQARDIVADAVTVTPRDILLCPSMEHQLRARRYAELVTACEAVG
jgi:hypothetical protein